jgi:peptide/nickel transport system substrate-binding protein
MSRKLFVLVSLLTVVALLLTGCRPAATPAPAAEPTAEPAAWEAKYNLTAPDPSYGGEMQSIEALDQYTVKFTLNNPDPAFLSKVAFGAFDIHSAKQLEETGGGGDILDNPLGTGPYMVQEWVRGDHLTLVPNPYYWGEAPKNQGVVMRWNTEAAARLVELQAGTADCMDNPSPDDFSKIEADSNLNLIPRPPMNVLYLGMNNTHAPFDNEKVRQAVAMAIDKQRFVDNYFPEGSTPAEQFMPPALVPGFTAEPKWYDYDVEAAKALLTEAGFPDGFETTLSYRDVVRGYQPLANQLAQEFQSQLARIGIKATLKVMESGDFLAAVSAGEEPLFMLGWLQDYPDPTDWVDYHFTGASDDFGEAYPDLVEAIRNAAVETDPAKRTELYQPVNELIKQHVPMVPVAHGTNAIVYTAAVEGAHASPLGNEEFRVMSVPGKDQIVWLQNAEPITLFANDETDGETFRACNAIFDTLYWYKVGTAELVPALAESYEVNDDLTEWTFKLRQDAKFSDGTPMDANDVVATFTAMWDASSPMHTGNTGVFEYYGGFFGSFLNAPTE